MPAERKPVPAQQGEDLVVIPGGVAERERLLMPPGRHLQDEFLAVLSHELKTPLNAIIGWTHMLRPRG